jgi:hypothetical protein
MRGVGRGGDSPIACLWGHFIDPASSGRSALPSGGRTRSPPRTASIRPGSRWPNTNRGYADVDHQNRPSRPGGSVPAQMVWQLPSRRSSHGAGGDLAAEEPRRAARPSGHGRAHGPAALTIAPTERSADVGPGRSDHRPSPRLTSTTSAPHAEVAARRDSLQDLESGRMEVVARTEAPPDDAIEAFATGWRRACRRVTAVASRNSACCPAAVGARNSAHAAMRSAGVASRSAVSPEGEASGQERVGLIGAVLREAPVARPGCPRRDSGQSRMTLAGRSWRGVRAARAIAAPIPATARPVVRTSDLETRRIRRCRSDQQEHNVASG